MLPSIRAYDLHKSRDHGITDYLTAKKFCTQNNNAPSSQIENQIDALKIIYK